MNSDLLQYYNSGVYFHMYVRKGLVYLEECKRDYGYFKTFDEFLIANDFIKNQANFDLSATIHLRTSEISYHEPWKIIENSRLAYLTSQQSVNFGCNITIGSYYFAHIEGAKSMKQLRKILVYCYAKIMSTDKHFSWNYKITLDTRAFFIDEELTQYCHIDKIIYLSIGELHKYLYRSHSLIALEVHDNIMHNLVWIKVEHLDNNIYCEKYKKYITYFHTTPTSVTITDINCLYDLKSKLTNCLKSLNLSEVDRINFEYEEDFILPAKLVPWINTIHQDNYYNQKGIYRGYALISDITKYYDTKLVSKLLLEEYSKYY